MKTIFLITITFLIVGCGIKKKQTELQTSREKQTDEIFIEGNADTIKSDYYSKLIIFDNIVPREKIYKYPDGKTPKEAGNTNEHIYKSFYINDPSLEKLKEIFNFYKLFYSKRAKEINNEVTLHLWFFDKKVPYEVANPENLDADPKYEKNIICVFTFNYRNGYYLENCSTYPKLNNHYYTNKK